MKLVLGIILILFSTLAFGQTRMNELPLAIDIRAPEGVAITQMGTNYIGDFDDMERMNRAVYVDGLLADFVQRPNGEVEVHLNRPIQVQTIDMKSYEVSEIAIRSFVIQPSEGFMLKISQLTDSALFSKSEVDWSVIDDFKERTQRGEIAEIYQEMREGKSYPDDFYRFDSIRFGISVDQLAEAQELKSANVEVLGVPEKHPRDAVYELNSSRAAIHTLAGIQEIYYEYEGRIAHYLSMVAEFAQELNELRERNWLPMDEFERRRAEAQRSHQEGAEIIQLHRVRSCRRVFAR
ncbi:MAG: hypothetical protein HRT44_03740 [Bdellovibrionales bacterium]|nr:hypothetical protein [Bdellovibrionales bacterium]NQZ18356.1 hypothetical protein [Bdellovibrionales bacterium]